MNKKLIFEIITNVFIVLGICSCILFCSYQSFMQFEVIEKINGRVERIEQKLNIKGK